MTSKLWRTLSTCLLLTAAACDVEIKKVNCDKTPDDALCTESDLDSGVEEDDAAVASDAGPDSGATGDAGKPSVDAGDASAADAGAAATAADAATDAGAADAGPAIIPLSIDEFCTAQYESAIAWREALYDRCNGKFVAEQGAFLERSLRYKDTSVDGCVANFKTLIETNKTVTYHPERAQACATAYSQQFAGAPASFPDAGVDVGTYEGQLGHGYALPQQIPACREALVGSIKRDQPCVSTAECADGLRCRTAPGGGAARACQPAITGGVCESSAECTDDYRCAGSTLNSGSKTCVKATELGVNGARCSSSQECALGLVCSNNICTTAKTSLICTP
jgi:hypothetical protein